jgi:MATE family multidrug resistance protein
MSHGSPSSPHPAPRILRLAAPVIFAMLTQTLINIMDTYFVGKLDPSISIPGQAALGYSLPLLWIVGGCLSAVSVGTQAITARRFGARLPLEAGQVLTNSLVIAASTGLLFSILSYAAAPWMFSLLTSNDSVSALGVPYAQMRFLGTLSMVATASYKAFFDGIGKTHVHLFAAMVMNVLNFALNYALIFGFWIFPRMEVTGAGLASLISTYVGLFIMIAWTFGPSFLKQYHYYKLSNINKKIIWEIARLSIPSGLATVFVMLGILIFIKIVGLLDEDAIAQTLSASAVYDGPALPQYTAQQELLLSPERTPGAALAADWAFTALQNRPAVFSAATKVIFDTLSLCFISAIAFGTATATLVSQSLGEGKPDMAERYGWESARLFAILMGALGALVAIFPEHTLDLISDDAIVIQTGAHAMRLLGPLMPVIAVAIIFTQALFGAGNSRFVMYAELILHFTCLVPLSYLLAITLDLGFNGVWFSAIAYLVLLALIMGWKFWEGKWKDIKV